MLTVALVAAFSFPAHAQAVCGSRDAIVNRLQNGFLEQVRAVGIAADGKLFEVFASKNGTWSIIVTMPGGPTCLMSVGDNWQWIDEIPLMRLPEEI